MSAPTALVITATSGGVLVGAVSTLVFDIIRLWRPLHDKTSVLIRRNDETVELYPANRNDAEEIVRSFLQEHSVPAKERDRTQ